MQPEPRPSGAGAHTQFLPLRSQRPEGPQEENLGIEMNIQEVDLGVSLSLMGFPGGVSGKEPSANSGDIRDTGLIPELERSPGEEHGNHSSILAWRIPWTEEPGGLQSIGWQRVGLD